MLVHIYVCNKKNRGHEFEREKGGIYGRVLREKRKGEMMKL